MQPDARSLTGLRALILVVERDPHVQRLGRYSLEDAGFVVEFVTDGERALLLARQHLPAIVITEILVRKRLSVCRALKADPATHGMLVLIPHDSRHQNARQCAGWPPVSDSDHGAGMVVDRVR